MFERLLSLRDDVGLLAEEYDPHARRRVGNFPQAFSHLALIGTALNLHEVGPAQRREPESAPLATSSRSVLSEGVLEWTLARRRAAGRADHVDEGAQRGRDLPMPGIIEEQSFKRWRPVFQNADQLARAQERLGQSFDCVCDP